MSTVQWEKDAIMLSTIHTDIFVEAEKVDRVGKKIRKPQAVCH